ncbi:MAG TPA: hypothetical protein VLT45_24635 [Kofleriaceae bacterium]|nr:hypothetical protein [Kofleriaceae bacterium]
MDTVTLTTGETDTMYGTYVAGTAYLAFLQGSRGDAWRGLDADSKKRAFVMAKRKLDALAWDPTLAGSQVLREAIPAFVTASYELAAIVGEDISQLSGGDGVTAISGGGVSVSFDPQVTGASPGVLPVEVLALIATYLKSPTASGFAATGTDEPAFGTDSDGNPVEYTRWRPF